MRELHYGSGVITVSFSVCDAVFDYTVALANAGKTDRITVPVVADGQRGFSNLLLGPNTELYCTAVPGQAASGTADEADEIDLDDDELVEQLRRKTAVLAGNTSVLPSHNRLNHDQGELD